MSDRAHRCREVWEGWRAWPLFRLTGWIIAIWFLLMLADHRLETVQTHDRQIYDWVSAIRNDLALPLQLIPVALILGVPMLIVTRLKRQTADWRCTLVPGFRGPHVVVAFLIALAILFVMAVLPVALDLFQQWEREYEWRQLVAYRWSVYLGVRMNVGNYYLWVALAEFSALLLVVTVVGLITTCGSPWMTIAISFVCWCCYALLGWGNRQWYEALDNAIYDHPLILGFLAWSLLWYLWLWVRLANMAGSRDTIGADDRVPWLAKLLVAPPPRTAGDWMHTTPWQRVRHRRLVGLGHRFIWLVAIYVAGVISLSPLLRPDGDWTLHDDYTFGALVVAVITSSLAIGLTWPQRLAALADVELLRPALRRTFVTEFGLAMLYDTSEIFLATLLLMLGPIAYWSPGSLHSVHFWIAALSAYLSQILVFGAIAWTMRSRSAMLAIAATLGAILAAIVLIDGALANRYLGPGVAVLAGIALTADAYRRWVKADML